ncbi:MAG: translation elongation factor Ts [Propionibacteriaceae bacterium]
MASITAKDVQNLRQATGAGMMDAKKALTEADGDFEAAVEILRISGLAKAAKRADREASNGIVAASGNALIQLAAETDFVAKNEEFVALADAIAKAVDQNKADGVAAANAVKLESGETVEDAIATLLAKIGEKLELKEAAYFYGTAHIYLHRRSQDLPPQVGVGVLYEGGDDAFARGIAMQIAAMSPTYLTRDDVPADVVENERRIAEATSREEGKPEAALPKIIEGRLNGFFKDVALLDQPSVSDDKKSVGKLLEENGVKIIRFVRFSAGN